MRLNVLLQEARACTICETHLPLGPKPLLQAAPSSKILLIGQAPGAATHEKGIPWDDRSGDRLREWLGITREQFYDPKLFAHMPMGFCYPGTGASGDMPPRPECAPQWHPPLLESLKKIGLTLYIGKYAIDSYLRFKTLTAAVQAHDDLLPERLALPHPSPRNNLWLKKNPWFERETLPALGKRITNILP